MKTRKQHKILNRQSGSVLVVVILIISALVLLGSTAYIMTSTDLNISGNYKLSEQAFYAAEAGISEAKTRMQNQSIPDNHKDSTGWAAYIGSEIKDARRTLPLALIFGIGLIVLLYLLLNSLFVRGTSVGALAQVGNVGVLAAHSGYGDWGVLIFTLLTGVAIIGTLNSTILIGPRIYYSMARDGLLFKTVGTLDGRRGTPRHGLLIQAAWASVLVHMGGFETILNYTTLMIIVLSALTVAGVMILRHRRPEVPRGFRVPLYPLVPALYVAMSVFLIVILSLENRRQIIAAGLMLALGLCGYAVFCRLERRRAGRPG